MNDPSNDAPVVAEPAVEQPVPPPAHVRPPEVPEKFWDSDAGAVRIDALVKSYVELERKLHSNRRDSDEPAPAAPETIPPPIQQIAVEPGPWTIASPHPLIEPDGELNELLRAAGFTETQAQLVYDLAADRLVPVIQDALEQIDAQRQLERLQHHFGGAEAWSNTARQLKSWAATHLDPAVRDTLAGSYEGILALHQMMRASEPELLADASGPAGGLSEAALTEMVRDPRYWQQRDPEFVARVTAGFKRLYAG